MEEKSDIEILRDFAKSTNRSIEVQEIPYPRTGIGTTQKFKRMVYMPNNLENTSFFIWFNDPYLKIGQSTIFSGTFIPLPSKTNAKLNIRRKYFLDKLNIFSETKAIKIGNDHFDTRVVITGSLDAPAKRFLAQSKIQKQILMTLEIARFVNISFNEYKIDFVPELNTHPNFGIINRQAWEIDKNTIEHMFRRIESIRELKSYNI